MGTPPSPVINGCKRCSRCRRFKRLVLFHVSHKAATGRQAMCKACKKKLRPAAHQAEYHRQKMGGLGSYRFAQARGCARHRGRVWSLTAGEFYALISNPCYYCGDKLNTFGVGLDRLDNSRGYEPGNVVPCCGDCNHVRSDRFSREEMLLIGKVIRRIKKQRRQQCQSA